MIILVGKGWQFVIGGRDLPGGNLYVSFFYEGWSLLKGYLSMN